MADETPDPTPEEVTAELARLTGEPPATAPAPEPETPTEPEAASAAAAVAPADEGTQAAEPTEPEEAAAAPVPAAAAPAEPAEVPQDDKPAPAAPVPEPDEIEKDLTAAIETIAADDLLTDGQKAAERARLKAQLATYQRSTRDERDRQQREQAQSAETFWQKEAQSRGVKKEQLQQIWDTTLAGYAKKYPKADPTTYQVAAMEAYERQITAAKKPAAAPTPAKPAPPVNKGGARATPPTPQTRPPAPKAKTYEESLDEWAKTAASSGNAMDALGLS